ncbi:putative MarR-family regulatory protein (plasmid) [Streptantibioticus cattleyicolor NRRL 8057 = DSM 46488]|nr:MarR family transcriptional regulator [Streptantibioticus cattleyicolor]CCB72351.1 putative MarR-family regulatory protein [Streptantibioticus cattleyicolor NRRL 8057 = DSM 46488]
MEEVSGTAVAAARDLRVLFSRLRRRLKEASATEDLTAPQTSVLARLVKDGPSSASVLAGAERVRPQSMATTLAALESHGLIARAPDPEDGRRQVVTLTPAGRERAEGVRATRDEWLARAFQDRYTDGERATITEALRLLDRLTQP